MSDLPETLMATLNVYLDLCARDIDPLAVSWLEQLRGGGGGGRRNRLFSRLVGRIEAEPGSRSAQGAAVRAGGGVG